MSEVEICWRGAGGAIVRVLCCRDGGGGGLLQLQSDSHPLPVYHALATLLAHSHQVGQHRLTQTNFIENSSLLNFSHSISW